MIEDVTTLSLRDRHRTRFNITKIPATGFLGVTLVTRNKKMAVTMLLTARQHERLLRFLTNTPIFKETA